MWTSTTKVLGGMLSLICYLQEIDSSGILFGAALAWKKKKNILTIDPTLPNVSVTYNPTMESGSSSQFGNNMN